MFLILGIRQYYDTKIAYCRFQFDSISTNIYGRDGVYPQKLVTYMEKGQVLRLTLVERQNAAYYPLRQQILCGLIVSGPLDTKQAI